MLGSAALLFLLLSLSSCRASPGPGPAQRPRAGDVLATIATAGPEAAIDRYFVRDSAFGEAVFEGVASGDSTWLEVARLLRPASDAGVSEDLDIGLAEALPKAPEHVLALLDSHFELGYICGIPFIEQPDSEAAAYHRRAREALGRVAAPGLAARRDSCRHALDHSRPALQPR